MAALPENWIVIAIVVASVLAAAATFVGHLVGLVAATAAPGGAFGDPDRRPKGAC
jgi:hypothetical protein